MEFLREFFGENALTFDQFTQLINAHNGNEANKDNQIKIGNLGGGDYVSKGKFDAMQEALHGKEAELLQANELINTLKAGTKGNEELQSKIAGYEQTVSALQQELQETKIKSALKVALLTEKPLDLDYMTFKAVEKIKEDGKSFELDENDNIKGWNDFITALKTQMPTQFENSGTDKYKVVGDNRLPKSDTRETAVTAETFKNMSYEERVKLKQDNEGLYRQLAKK